MLLVECNVLERVKVINEGTKGKSRLRMQGKFQQCDEQNNNGRIYPRSILESQVKAIQEKIKDRSLVGALDHPANDAIHLSQASHVITNLWVDKDGSVMGECEILSTPNGKIVEALLDCGVKIGISSRGVGSVSESIKGKVVNEDFKLITFDLVSDPSTRGAFPGICESMRENSERAQKIVSKHKKDRVLLTMLESKITQALESKAAQTPTVDKTPDQLSRQVTKTPADRQMTIAHKLEKSATKKRIIGHPGAASTKDIADGARNDAVATAKEEEKKKTPTEPKGKQGMFNFGEEGSEGVKEAAVEALKKVCWGDRYNEGSIKDDPEAFEKAKADAEAQDEKVKRFKTMTTDQISKLHPLEGNERARLIRMGLIKPAPPQQK